MPKIKRSNLTRRKGKHKIKKTIVNDKATNDPHSTNQSTKRIKLELEHETNIEETNLYETQDVPPKLSLTQLPSKTTGEGVISTWCESLVSKLEEFDECTRRFLMNQIDNYVMDIRLQRLKYEKEDAKISLNPIHSLSVEVPCTSQCCEFVVKEEVLDIPAEI